MRVFRSSYRDRAGRQRQTRKWYVEFRDQHEIIRRVSAFSNRRASEELGRNIEQLVAYHLATGGQTDPSLQRWITELPQRMRDRLVSIGLIHGERVAVTKPLREHIEDYGRSLRARGNTEKHVTQSITRLHRLFEACRFHYLGDISASKLQTHLSDLRGGGSGITIQTSNYYLATAKAFCRWMVRDGRAPNSPLDHLSKLNTETDRKRRRRALSADELRWLISVVAESGIRSELSGAQRALLYRLAVETGLRVGELGSLTRRSFDLEGSPPTVTVEAGYSKRRRTDVLPLRPDTVKHLAAALEKIEDASTLFPWSSTTHLADTVRSDMRAAREIWLERSSSPGERAVREKSDFLRALDSRGRVVDFHALRHTFITNLASGGVHPKTAQMLARHSTISLTMDRYTHSEQAAELDALAALPDLSVSADCLAQNGASEESAGDSERLETDKGEDAETPANTGQNSDSGGVNRRARDDAATTQNSILSPLRLPIPPQARGTESAEYPPQP